MIGACAFAFGPFLLAPERQLLLRGDKIIRIGGRALDILTALVERPGEVVPKSDLIARAWPTTTVDDCNLKVNIAALRRALGDDAGNTRYIATVSGRGYRFVAPVEAHANPGPRRAAADDVPRVEEPVEIVGYGILFDGEIALRHDETIVLLKPGAGMARRGHNSRTAGLVAGPCRMLLIPLDGD